VVPVRRPLYGRIRGMIVSFVYRSRPIAVLEAMAVCCSSCVPLPTYYRGTVRLFDTRRWLQERPLKLRDPGEPQGSNLILEKGNAAYG